MYVHAVDKGFFWQRYYQVYLSLAHITYLVLNSVLHTVSFTELMTQKSVDLLQDLVVVPCFCSQILMLFQHGQRLVDSKFAFIFLSNSYELWSYNTTHRVLGSLSSS